MMNITFLRGTRKAYVYYAIGFSLVVMVGLVMKNFNDKIALMTGSVHSYQTMVDQQSIQLKAVSMEKDRLKRDLDDNDASLRQMRTSLAKLDKECKEQEERMDDDLTALQSKFSALTAQYANLENKYKTMSKSNAEAIADIDNLNNANRRLRDQVEEVSSVRTAELIKLRDSVGKLTQERDKYKDQYSALFKQQQQSLDSIQLLQDEKDRLQEQIREIQRLSGGVHQGIGKVVSSSAVPVVEQPRVMAEPNKQLSSSTSSTSSTPPSEELQGAEPRHAELPPIPAPASKPQNRVSKPAPLVAAPPAAAFSKPSKPTSKLNQQVQVPIGAQVVKGRQEGFFKQREDQVINQRGDQFQNFLYYPEKRNENNNKPPPRQVPGQQQQFPVYKPQFLEQQYNQQYNIHDQQYNIPDQDNDIDVNQELDEDDLDGLQAPDHHAPFLFNNNGDNVYQGHHVPSANQIQGHHVPSANQIQGHHVPSANQIHPLQPAVRHLQQPAVRQLQPAVRNGQPPVRNVQPIRPAVHNVQPDVRNMRPDARQIRPAVRNANPEVRNVQPAVHNVQQAWGRQQDSWRQRDF